MTTGSFVEVERLRELAPGTATRRDVQGALGTPDGLGHALLPGDRSGREIWYYGDLEVRDVQQSASGRFQARASQRILLVTFQDGVLDGFLWWSNEGEVSGD